MVYRELPAAGVVEFTGAGVYYGTVKTEAPAFRDRRVFVVGGGNSAGQAAMYLAGSREKCTSSCAVMVCTTRCRIT